MAPLDVGGEDLNLVKQTESLARRIQEEGKDIPEEVALKLAQNYMLQAIEDQQAAPHLVRDARQHAYKRFLSDLRELTSSNPSDNMTWNRRPKRHKGPGRKRRR